MGEDMYKEISYTYPELPYNSIQWLPTLMTATQKHKDHPQPFSSTTLYTYDEFEVSLSWFLGQLVTSRTVDSNGYETERSITKGYTTLERFQMTHDVNTGNLLSRQYNSNPQETFTYDNLGSVLSILDSNGEPVFQAIYDVWGQQEVTLNEIGFHRGYTGHEMLPEFGIINMNGRLYDPVLGRFFSPDNYVQAPTNSQNFNRYSYCLNNPLKYTDPSGNIFGIDDAFFAFAVYGIASSMMQAAAFDKNVWKAGAASLLASIGTYGIGQACGALASYNIMSGVGLECCRSGFHGLNSGLISALQGGNFGKGFII